MKTKIRSQPRGNNAICNSPEETDNIKKLLDKYHEVPLHILTLLYKEEYNTILDCLARKIEGGLINYLLQMFENIELFEDEFGTTFVRKLQDNLRENKENFGSFMKKRFFEKELRAFFNDSSPIWRGCVDLLDRRDNFHIDPSPYEQAQQAKPDRLRQYEFKLNEIFNYFPKGVEYSILCKYINHDLFRLGVNVDEYVDALPELFFRSKSISGYMVLDGRNHTYSDLTGRDDSFFNQKPEDIVKEVIQNGLYQKTLVLLRSCGLAGLKIHVWYRSMQRSFYKSVSNNDQNGLYRRTLDQGNELDKYGGLTFFMALARFGLVEIREGEKSKNDLRAFIPKKTSKEIEPVFKDFDKRRSHSVGSEPSSAPLATRLIRY